MEQKENDLLVSILRAEIWKRCTWQEKRKIQLVKRPYCETCWRNKEEIVEAVDVWNMTPKKLQDPRFFESLCRKCHKQIVEQVRDDFWAGRSKVMPKNYK